MYNRIVTNTRHQETINQQTKQNPYKNKPVHTYIKTTKSKVHTVYNLYNSITIPSHLKQVIKHEKTNNVLDATKRRRTR